MKLYIAETNRLRSMASLLEKEDYHKSAIEDGARKRKNKVNKLYPVKMVKSHQIRFEILLAKHNIKDFTLESLLFYADDLRDFFDEIIRERERFLQKLGPIDGYQPKYDHGAY